MWNDLCWLLKDEEELTRARRVTTRPGGRNQMYKLMEMWWDEPCLGTVFPAGCVAGV